VRVSETSSAPATRDRPSNFLVLAIISILAGFFPLGIVSTVYACRVDDLWLSGRRDEALIASRRARSWAVASFITSAALLALTTVLSLLLLLAVLFSERYGHWPWQFGAR
jgi:hypothetical protein